MSGSLGPGGVGQSRGGWTPGFAGVKSCFALRLRPGGPNPAGLGVTCGAGGVRGGIGHVRCWGSRAGLVSIGCGEGRGAKMGLGAGMGHMGLGRTHGACVGLEDMREVVGHGHIWGWGEKERLRGS